MSSVIHLHLVIWQVFLSKVIHTVSNLECLAQGHEMQPGPEIKLLTLQFIDGCFTNYSYSYTSV